MRGQQRLKNRVTVTVNENAKDGLTQGQRGKMDRETDKRMTRYKKTDVDSGRLSKEERETAGGIRQKIDRKKRKKKKGDMERVNKRVHCGPLALPFACMLAPLTRSLAPHYSLRSSAPLRSLALSLTHLVLSLARGTVNDWRAIFSMFFFHFGP